MKNAPKLFFVLAIIISIIFNIAPYFKIVLARTLGYGPGFILVYIIFYKLLTPGKHNFLHTVNMFLIVWLLNFFTVLILGGFPGYNTIPFAPATVVFSLTFIVVPIYRIILNSVENKKK